MLVKCIAAYPSIFNRLRAIARYWLEIETFFPIPLAFNAPVGGDPLGRSSGFWWVSCRMARLQYGAKIPEKLNPLSRVHARHIHARQTCICH